MMDRHPKISCIMPAYNAARYIRIAIDSILSQTFDDFELIIINDGSTDETEKIIQSYDDSRIVYLKNETNLKLIKTLNRGIDIAKGEFISRMDSDDQAMPTLFEMELKEFSKYSEAGIVNTLTFHMSEDGRKIKKNRRVPYLSSKAMSVICPFCNMISHPGVMVRADLMKKYKYRDDAMVVHLEDLDLWCRMFTDGIVCKTLKKRLLRYRTSSESVNSVYGKERYIRRKKIVAYYLKKMYGWEHEIFEDVNEVGFCKKNSSCFGYFFYLLKNKKISIFTFFELMKWLINELCGDLKNFVTGKKN